MRWFVLFLALAMAPRALAGDHEAFRESYAYEVAGNPTAALQSLDDLSGAASRGYVAEVRRGWLHYLAAQYEASVVAYDRAIATAPKAVEPRLGRLLPLLALRRWQDAEQAATAILQDDPENRIAQTRRAWALFNLGRYEEAEAAYRAVLAAYPADPDVAAGVGWCLLRQGRTDKAVRAFEEVLAWAPDHPAALDGLASARSGTL